MSEKYSDVSSPADAKKYDAGISGKGEASKVTSTAEGISTPKPKTNWKTSHQNDAGAAAASPESIAQDKSLKHGAKPNLSDRRK